MRKKIVFITFSLLLIAANAFALSLNVSVTNATKGKKLPGYTFKIVVVNPEKADGLEVLKEDEFMTGPAGTFNGDVDVSSGKAIMGEINYRGVVYYSPLIDLEEGRKDYKIDFNVYEITDDEKNIEVLQRTMKIMPYDAKTLLVYDTLTIENNSRLTYVGKYNEESKVTQALFIPLPRGYSLMNIRGVDREGIYTFAGGVVSRSEIFPGKSTVFLNYFIKSDIGIFDMSMQGEGAGSSVKKISVFFQNKENWKAESSTLKHAGERQFEGGVYGTFHVWEGRELHRIKFKVLSPSYRGGFNLWYISILSAMIISLGGLLILKDRIYRWYMVKEKRSLEKTLQSLGREADKEDLSGYYKPFRNVLESRKREIEERLGS